MKNLRAYLLLGSAVVLCPCHLPFPIGLLAGGVGGSAAATFLSQNLALVPAYFLFALWMGQRLLARNTTCSILPGRSVDPPPDQVKGRRLVQIQVASGFPVPGDRRFPQTVDMLPGSTTHARMTWFTSFD